MQGPLAPQARNPSILEWEDFHLGQNMGFLRGFGTDGRRNPGLPQCSPPVTFPHLRRMLNVSPRPRQDPDNLDRTLKYSMRSIDGAQFFVNEISSHLGFRLDAGECSSIMARSEPAQLDAVKLAFNRFLKHKSRVPFGMAKGKNGVGLRVACVQV